MRSGFTRLLAILVVGACGGDPAVPRVAAEAAGVSDEVVLLEGRVRRFPTDQLLEGASVRAGRQTITSDGKGAYVVTDLAEGEVQITATLPGFLPYSARQRLRPGRNRHDIDLVSESGR